MILKDKKTRHIPQQNIRELGPVSFDCSLKEAVGSPQEFDRSVWLFVPAFYTEYRYILGTRGENPLICIGINPSTAEPNALDPTLKSVERIALANGYDSFLMFNLSAQRATIPDDLDPDFNEELHRENMKAFEYLLGLSAHPHIWAAWGTLIMKRPYFALCLDDMIRTAGVHDPEWLCAGKLSKDGHPHHPLYLRKDEKLKPFDAASYSAMIRSYQKNTV